MMNVFKVNSKKNKKLNDVNNFDLVFLLLILNLIHTSF